eukprot:scaffold4554_cov178-Amphora_coffeaeformis.AAC.10
MPYPSNGRVQQDSTRCAEDGSCPSARVVLAWYGCTTVLFSGSMAIMVEVYVVFDRFGCSAKIRRERRNNLT